MENRSACLDRLGIVLALSKTPKQKQWQPHPEIRAIDSRIRMLVIRKTNRNTRITASMTLGFLGIFRLETNKQTNY